VYLYALARIFTCPEGPHQATMALFAASAATSDSRLPFGDGPALVIWLMTSAVGPALVALPVNGTAGQFGGAARRWLDRIRHADG
jgi:hypothetical protein